MSGLVPCWNQVTGGVRPPRDLARDLAAIREGGWEVVELWLAHWERCDDATARRLLSDAGLEVAGACAQEGLYFSTGEEWSRRREELVRSLARCQALGAPRLVVVPVPSPPVERRSVADLERAAENLRAAGELAGEAGVRLGIEFLRSSTLVNNLPTALGLARSVDHPAVRVLVDTFHLYAGPSKLEDLGLLEAEPGRLDFVHLNDAPGMKPRELWTDPDRVLPGEGVLPLGAVMEAIRRSGYAGPCSLELFSEAFAQRFAEDPVGAAAVARRRVAELL